MSTSRDDFDMIPGLPAEEVERRLLAAKQLLDESQAEIGFYRSLGARDADEDAEAAGAAGGSPDHPDAPGVKISEPDESGTRRLVATGDIARQMFAYRDQLEKEFGRPVSEEEALEIMVRRYPMESGESS